MAASVHSDPLAGSAIEDGPRQSLCRIVETYGLAVCGDPWRCEALLRDFCPGRRREIFWIVAALKENIAADLKAGLETAADAILIARVAHKLSENLGLAAEPARWTAETWLAAVRCAPASAIVPDVAQISRTELPAWPTDDGLGGWSPLPAGVDWRWLALCVSAALCSVLAIADVARLALVHGAGARGWLLDTGVLLAGLGLSAAGEYTVARAFLVRGPQRRPAPAQAPWALLPEILVLLLQPLVLVLVPALWLGEWIGQWHLAGPSHDFAFHLGRALQTLPLAAFLYKWWDWMLTIQGRLASTLVRSS